MTEIERPMAVRRTVSFCDAVYDGLQEVEGINARRVASFQEMEPVWQAGELPLIVDPECRIREELKPEVIIDAILAKRNLGTRLTDAPLVLGLGPGFEAGKDVHAVIETNRGHNLGKVLWSGSAEQNTGIPGDIGGYTSERVLRASKTGVFSSSRKIGEMVQADESVALVDDAPVRAAISGVLRGIIRDGTSVKKGFKLGDIDPRGKREYCFTISDKARAISGGVLEGIMSFFGNDTRLFKPR
jgi:xanthine dehydrogenase accessory factor